MVVADRHQDQSRHLAFLFPFSQILQKDLHARDVGERTVVLPEVVVRVRLQDGIAHGSDLNAGLRRVRQIHGSKTIVVK
jgi:hypothetical protein